MLSATSAAVIPRPLPRIDTVVFPTDFSPCAHAALPYACTLAEQNHATLHLLNVLGTALPAGPLLVPYVEPSAAKQAAERELQKVMQGRAPAAFRTEMSVRQGSVCDTVCQTAPERNGLIVMGTHGRRGVRQLVLGSVAEQIFRRSLCPVITVGPGAPKSGPRNGRFATVLVALDLVADPTAVMDWGRLFATANQSRLILFHAIRESVEAEAALPNYLDDAVASARKKMISLQPREIPWVDLAIKIGDPAEKVVETAADRDVDLVIIGASRGTALSAHAPWAVAHDIVCASPCPVLTVRH